MGDAGYVFQVSELDDDGMTPLHKATKQGRESTVRLLLRLGANPSIEDKHHKRPMDYALTADLETALQQQK